MNFGLSEEQILLKSTLRRFLEEQCPTTRVRAVMDGESGHDAALWEGLAGLGVTGLTVPAELGGSGLELLDLALAAEELGYGAAPGPFLGNAMATVALAESEDAEQRNRWLPRIASGEAVLTVAFGEEESSWDPAALRTRAARGKIEGSKPLVPYGADAAAFVVAAHDEEGPGLWIVEQGAPGVEIRKLQVVDATRRLHSVTFRGAPGAKLAGGSGALRRSLDAGAVLVAADAFGGAKRCLDVTVG
ncbi:MAG: acyl-CoA dehydrogenase family protein, partial [Candidatus Binatia bacterium]